MKKNFIVLFVTINLFTLSLFALSLDEAIKHLQLNNHDLKIAQEDIKTNELKISQKKSSYFGDLDFVSSFSKYNNLRTLAPLAPPLVGDITVSDELTSVGLSYKVNLFDGFKTTNELESNKLLTKIAQEKQKLTLNEKIYFTQSIYLDILALEKILKSQLVYNETLSKLKDTINLEITYGKKPKLDLLKVDADIQKNREIITSLKTNIDILTNTLSITIFGEIQEISKLEEISEDIVSVPPSIHDIEAVPTLKIAQNSQQKAVKNYKSSLSSYYPNLNFQVNYNDVYGADDDEIVSSAILSLNWKIFDFGLREKSVQIAKIETLKSSLEYEKTKLAYENKIYEANKHIKENEKLLLSAKSQIALASKIEEVERLKYKEGQSSINDLLIASSNEKIVKAKYIETKYKLEKSKFYLHYLTKE